MSTIDLNPCKCGSKWIVIVGLEEGPSGPLHGWCTSCNRVSKGSNTRDGAAEKWNAENPRK